MSEQSFLMGLKVDFPIKGILYSALATIYLHTQRFELFYKYLSMAVKEELRVHKAIRDPNLILYLAEFYLYKGDWKKAEAISHQASLLIEKLPSIKSPDEVFDISPTFQEFKSRIYYV